jgi:hypothetical protein
MPTIKRGRLRNSGRLRNNGGCASSDKRARVLSWRRVMTLVSLLLVVTAAAAIFAHAGKSGAVTRKGALPLVQPPPPLPANSPSKEYVYAGGRLVATEEPAAP